LRVTSGAGEGMPADRRSRMTGSIEMYFSRLPDPRGDRGRRHLLSDIMVIAILAVICGAEHWTEMEEFGQGKEEWLKTFLKLPHGIPSHDTFGEVFAALDPDAFEACFRAWTQAVAGAIVGIAAIDGKTLRRSYDRATGNAALHMVSAWAADNGVVFGQVAVKDKSNEITAIPALLRMLQIRGLIITIDAMGCQKEIAEQIVQQGGEYVLRVKDNQPTLRRDIEAMFQWAERRDYAGLAHAHSEEVDKGHGRIEKRRASVLWELGQITDAQAWPGLQCIVKVRSERIKGEDRTVEDRYYISSMHTRRATELARAVRLHWGIENGLHWRLDMTFGEDSSRVRVRNAAQNLSRLRRLVLNLLKLDTSDPKKKRSIKAKRFRASIDLNYLIALLRHATPSTRVDP
jgi:predicted transposase YbfD/YdcC